MTVETAKAVIKFMEKYNNHFEELETFVSEKKAKVIADDLVWLLDSLVREQKLVMEGNNLEVKRMALFEEHGIIGKKAKQLISECPEEYRAKLALECVSMEKYIDRIKEITWLLKAHSYLFLCYLTILLYIFSVYNIADTVYFVFWAVGEGVYIFFRRNPA